MLTLLRVQVTPLKDKLTGLTDTYINRHFLGRRLD
jgi:hypothetical protein